MGTRDLRHGIRLPDDKQILDLSQIIFRITLDCIPTNISVSLINVINSLEGSNRTSQLGSLCGKAYAGREVLV